MFSSVRTSIENKSVVTKLTNKLGLGAENVVARMAIAYSLENSEKLKLTDLKDSRGKEYSRNVLFGDYQEIYIGMICARYGLYKLDKDIPKYIKLHLDEGLSLLNTEYESNLNMDIFDFLVENISDDKENEN